MDDDDELTQGAVAWWAADMARHLRSSETHFAALVAALGGEWYCVWGDGECVVYPEGDHREFMTHENCHWAIPQGDND